MMQPSQNISTSDPRRVGAILPVPASPDEELGLPGRVLPLTSVPRHLNSRWLEPELRTGYLLRIAKGEVPPVVLVSGASGAGKSYVIAMLEEIGIERGIRFISRPRRECDPAADVPWAESLGKDDMLLSYSKFGHSYGFPASSLAPVLREVGAAPVSLLLGDLGKIVPFRSAIETTFPFVPVVSIRIDVPLDVAARRMESIRSQCIEGEASHRDEFNRAISAWETRQIALLKRTFGLHTIINLSEEEHREFGHSNSQLLPLDKDLLQKLFGQFRDRSLEHFASLAKELLRVTQFKSGIPGLEEPQMQALTKVILPAFKEVDIELHLKGGVAVAAYLEVARQAKREFHPDELIVSHQLPLLSMKSPSVEANRTVSPDIDWCVAASQDVNAHANVISSLSGKSISVERQIGKAVYSSTKLAGSVNLDGVETSLDAIVSSRIVDHSGFNFIFEYSDTLQFYHRQIELDNGLKVCLVPPELLLVEKLVAGRGIEVAKLDLSDAISLLMTQPIQALLVQQLIFSQEFIAEEDTVSLTSGVPAGFARGEFELQLRSVGIENEGVLEAAFARVLAERVMMSASPSQYQPEEAEVGQTNLGQLDLSLSGLKQLRMIDRMLSSLELASSQLEHVVAGMGGHSLSEMFGESECKSAIDELRMFLLYLVEFHVGRKDVDA